MNLNPWKQVRQLRGIIATLHNVIKSLQAVNDSQAKLIAFQNARIEALTIEKTPVAAPGAGKYLN
jgi:hypothetical protein